MDLCIWHLRDSSFEVLGRSCPTDTSTAIEHLVVSAFGRVTGMCGLTPAPRFGLKVYRAVHHRSDARHRLIGAFQVGLEFEVVPRRPTLPTGATLRGRVRQLLVLVMLIRFLRAEVAPMTVYPRDLIGYGRNPPNADWPGGARMAVQFVLNYEEGGENRVLHGDAGQRAVSLGDHRCRELPGASSQHGVDLRVRLARRRLAHPR